MEKHFTFMVLLKFTTCKLQYCMLLGLEKKTGEGRLSSDKASKIMQLHFLHKFYVYIFLASAPFQFECSPCSSGDTVHLHRFLQKDEHSLHVSWVQVPPLRCNACIQLPKVHTEICQQEEDVADRFHTTFALQVFPKAEKTKYAYLKITVTHSFKTSDTSL